MTFDEAYEIAKPLGGQAELLSARLVVGQMIGGQFFPKRKVIKILGKPTGRPERSLPKLWMVTVKEP